MHPVPFKESGFSPLGSNGRSFLKQDTRTVWKIFDILDDRISPNDELMKIVGHSVTKGALSSDQRFVYIQYGYDLSDLQSNADESLSAVALLTTEELELFDKEYSTTVPNTA